MNVTIWTYLHLCLATIIMSEFPMIALTQCNLRKAMKK